MAHNSKTPVMVLHELTTKLGMGPPQYNILFAKEGTHENEFHQEVVVGGVRAVASGRSKQIAKHEAAQKALALLEEKGQFHFGETTIKAPKSEMVDSFEKNTVSYVMTLNELCGEHKMPFPTFTELSAVGPPHCKQFTYQCQVAAISTRGTAGSIKQAKQLSAKEMIERIGLTLPSTPPEVDLEQRAITDDAALAKYNEIHNLSKPNLAVKIEDYDTAFQRILKEKGLKLDDLQKFFEGDPTEEKLQKLFEIMDLQYSTVDLWQNPYMLVLKANTESPFVVMAHGESYEAAKKELLVNVFQLLQIMMR